VYFFCRGALGESCVKYLPQRFGTVSSQNDSSDELRRAACDSAGVIDHRAVLVERENEFVVVAVCGAAESIRITEHN
jgi:hypothetical protein